MSLLDDLVPDAKINVTDRRLEWMVPEHAVKWDTASSAVYPDVMLYSGPKVESLLAENRKQVLLEAAEYFRKTWKPLHDWDRHVADELRRMAEGETK